MREVVLRRYRTVLEHGGPFPHLILIDGGKGQLSAGMNVLAPLIERGTAVIGLAKRLEEVYLPGRSEPLEIAADSEGLRLLQRVRDEAHRFALDHHRGRRDKAMTTSLLDELRGVGPKRKRVLLEHFGSPERLVAASREELESVPGLPGKLARDIHRQLNKAG
jgi:excinuclease ABC subunit C